MKKYIKYILCSILFCCPYLTLAKVTCAVNNYSAIVELSKNEIGLNEKASIKVSSDYEYNVEYDIDNNKIIRIDENGNIIPLEIGNTKINVIIEFNDEDVKTECTSTLDIKVLSNDSSLEILNIEELDISNVFKSDVYEYQIRLPYSYEKINIIAEANDTNATITGDGRRYINEGTNEYEIIVKATDGTTSTYKIKILREEASDDVTLKNLLIEGYVLSPQFNKETHEYTLNVDENVDEITINAEPNYEYANVLGIGKYKLATGENKFYIKVIAENNTEEKYTIIVNKSKGNGKLSNLIIEGYELQEEFKSDVFIYNLTIKSDVEKLNIQPEVLDDEQVEIIGNEDLKVGENNIIIRVSSEDKGATTYKLIVNKLTVEEQKEIEKNDILLKVLLVIFIVSILIMLTVIGIFLCKNCKKNSKNNLNKMLKKQKKNKKRK